MIQEYETICSLPKLFFWSGYDLQVKYNCSSSALVAPGGLVLIDPLPLAPEALTELLVEAEKPMVGILLTNGNHQRWSRELEAQYHVPIYTSLAAQGEVHATHFYKKGECVFGLEVIELPGFALGETAFWHQEKKILILGDALTSAVEEGLLVLPKKYCTDYRLAMKSLATLKNFSPEILITAHGLPITARAAERLAHACTLSQ